MHNSELIVAGAAHFLEQSLYGSLQCSDPVIQVGEGVLKADASRKLKVAKQNSMAVLMDLKGIRTRIECRAISHRQEHACL